MVQGSLNPNITFLGEKPWPVAWKKEFTSVSVAYKPANRNPQRPFSKILKSVYLLLVQGHINAIITYKN